MGRDVAARGGGGWLSHALIALIVDCLRGIGQCFACLAARIGDGNHVRRGCTPRRKPEGRRPRPPNKPPQTFAWPIPPVPEAVVHRTQLGYPLREPEFAAPLATAPARPGRPLRSLCRMPLVPPPPILAPRDRYVFGLRRYRSPFRNSTSRAPKRARAHFIAYS